MKFWHGVSLGMSIAITAISLSLLVLAISVGVGIQMPQSADPLDKLLDMLQEFMP